MRIGLGRQMRQDAHVPQQARPVVDAVAGPERVDVDDAGHMRGVGGDEDVRLVEVTVDGLDGAGVRTG